MKTIAIIGLIVIFIGVVLYIYIRVKMVGDVFDGDDMAYQSDIKTLSYYHGGSDIGDSYNIKLSDYVIDVSKCEGNGMPETK